MAEMILQPLDTNADFVVFVRWLVPDGSRVTTGAVVCLVETSKATVELTAPESGVLRHRARPGDQVAVGAAFGAVLGACENSAGGAVMTFADSSGGTDRISRKARDLMMQHAIPENELPAGGFISVIDVEEYLAARERQNQAEAGGVFGLLEGINTNGVTFPADSGNLEEGRVDPAFLDRLRADPETVRKLPEEQRLALLHQHGAWIGDRVRLGAGTIIDSPQVVLRDGASIGDNGSVFCAQRFIMGPLARFGPNLNLRCQQAILGAGAYAEHDIVIGGGGNRDPWAVIVIGDDCYLGSELHLNTCRPILIGRNVFLTNRTTLLTHNVGHSYLDGHENRFAGVVIEDGCVIGFNTVIYAGARLGRSAVVGSNSYVVDSIPPGKLALGVPARVVGDAKQHLSPERREARAREIVRDLRRLLTAKGHDTADEASDGGDILRVKYQGREFGLVFSPTGPWEPLPAGISWVVWTLGPVAGKSGTDVVVMDLLGKQIAGAGDQLWVGTLREYLRKRGIKLQPSGWRYSGGLI